MLAERDPSGPLEGGDSHDVVTNWKFDLYDVMVYVKSPQTWARGCDRGNGVARSDVPDKSGDSGPFHEPPKAYELPMEVNGHDRRLIQLRAALDARLTEI